MTRPTYFITIAIIKRAGKYLIGRRAAHKKFAPNEWEFISGFVDTKESAEEIILREVKEETQLSGKILTKGAPFVIVDEEARWIVLPYVIKTSTSQAMMNVKDHSELRWVTKIALKEYKDLNHIVTQLQLQKLL